MFKSSGSINGRESVFVMPVETPVAMTVRAAALEARPRGWAGIAAEMAEDVSVSSPVSDVKEVKGVAPVSDVKVDENPYAWSDKDAGWQAGRD